MCLHRDQKETAGTSINQLIQEYILWATKELYQTATYGQQTEIQITKKYVTIDAKMKRSVKGLDILKSIISNGFPKKSILQLFP